MRRDLLEGRSGGWGGNETFCCPRFLSLPRPLMAERSAGAAGRWSGRAAQRGVRAAGGCAGSAVRGCAGCALERPRARCWCARGRVFNLLKLCRNVMLGVSRRSLLVRVSWLSMQSEMQMSFCQAVS